MTTIRVQGKPLYQWDTDRRVIIEPGNGVTIDDVHFSTDGENSLGVEHAADENGIVSAPIPNILLQSGSNITVYACMATDNGQHTIASRIVSVINRAKPADYVYTETEVKSYAALKKKLSEKLPANQGAENAGKALVIDDDGNVVPGEVQGSGETGAGVDITGAAAGQIPQIADVDENGVPTAWQPADLPSGGTPPLVVNLSVKDGGWVADRTRSEIIAHVEKGGSACVAVFGTVNAHYWQATATSAIFRRAGANPTRGGYEQFYYIDEAGVCTTKEQTYLLTTMAGATADAAGAAGVVPAPAAGDEGKYLRGDGTWGEIDIPEGGGGGIDQDELQAAVNAALEQAKSGLFVFEDSYVDNTANWLTNGYTKVSQTATIGQPSQCTGEDKWGVIFFVAENAPAGTGTQMYFPIDGTYKGRIFTRSITKRTPGSWYLLPTVNDISTSPGDGDGGGSGGGIVEIASGVDVSAVSSFSYSKDIYGNPLKVDDFWIALNAPNATTKDRWLELYVNGVRLLNIYYYKNDRVNLHTVIHKDYCEHTLYVSPVHNVNGGYIASGDANYGVYRFLSAIDTDLTKAEKTISLKYNYGISDVAWGENAKLWMWGE